MDHCPRVALEAVTECGGCGHQRELWLLYELVGRRGSWAFAASKEPCWLAFPSTLVSFSLINNGTARVVSGTEKSGIQHQARSESHSGILEKLPLPTNRAMSSARILGASHTVLVFANVTSTSYTAPLPIFDSQRPVWKRKRKRSKNTRHCPPSRYPVLDKEDATPYPCSSPER